MNHYTKLMIRDFIPAIFHPILRAAIHPITTTRKWVSRAGIPKLTWHANLNEEVSFWNAYFQTQGLEWHDDYLRRLDPSAVLQPHVAAVLPAGDVSILDVGAGPLTILGKVNGDRNLQITPTDPLAEEYDRLLSRYHVIPPIRTVYGKAEALTDLFRCNHFDLVHAENCIDHSYDPLRAFQQMLSVVKLGCYVLTRHEINEGENEGYSGLHQWNFYTHKGDFLIANRAGRTVNVTSALSRRAVVECESDGRLLTVKARKTKEA